MATSQPVPGVPVRPPLKVPGPGEVVVGYEFYQPQSGCCKCEGLSTKGFASIIILLFVFSPLAWIPCCMDECFEKQQRPIYGQPGLGQGQQGPPPPQAQVQPQQDQYHRGPDAPAEAKTV